MKKVKIYGLAVLALFAFVLPVQAQTLHYGIKVGPDFAVQSGIGEYFSNGDMRVGVHAGLAGSYNLSKHMMLVTEFDYDQAGSHSSQVTERYDYLSVPVLFDYSFGKTDREGMTMHLNIGPYISYLVNAKKVEDVNGTSTTTGIYSGANQGELGAMLGVGLIQPVGKHQVTMDVRLNLGLTPYIPSGGENDHNKSIGIYLGYML
ncbi:MAG: PorT family protein [Bacteroidales bacterium]|nr:PorT family protein [Bacteroidales bacterium]